MHVHQVADRGTGELIAESKYSGTQNGKNRWIMYRATMALLASGRIPDSAVRVYLSITAQADWRGVLASTRTAISREVKMTPQAVGEAIKVLKEIDLIRETKERGLPVFVVNPNLLPQKQLTKHRRWNTEDLAASS